MERETQIDPKLAEIFNSLSGLDKFKLRAVAMTSVMPGIVHADVKEHSWKSPIYTGVLVLCAVQPIPGVLETGMMIASRLPTKWGRMVRAHVGEKLDDANLAVRMRHLMIEKPKKPGEYRVDNLALAGYMVQEGVSETKEAALATLEGWRVLADKHAGPALYSAGETVRGKAMDVMDGAQALSADAAKTAGGAAADAWKYIRNNPLIPF